MRCPPRGLLLGLPTHTKQQYLDLRVQRPKDILTTKLTRNFKRVVTPLSPIFPFCLMGWDERSDWVGSWMVCSFLVLVLEGGFELSTPLGSVLRRSVSGLSLPTPLPFVVLLPAAYELTENDFFYLLRKLVNALLGRLTTAHRSAIHPKVSIYTPGTLATGVSSRNRTLAALSYHPCLLTPQTPPSLDNILL
jgi:hypothetical protein